MERDDVRKAIKAKRLAKKVTIAEVAKALGRNPKLRAGELVLARGVERGGRSQKGR